VERDNRHENPAEVARKGYVALMQGKKREIVGTRGELEDVINDILPDSWLPTALGNLFDQNPEEQGTVTSN
jgi:hypothetical protein